MKQPFKLVHDDKWLLISGPCEMQIAIDFDDVDHEVVERQARMLVRILNQHFQQL